MPSMNHVILAGYLKAKPELRRTSKSGLASATMSVTIGRRRKNGTTDVTVVPLTALGRLAEVAHAYLERGSPLLIEGRLETRAYEKDDESRFFTGVLIKELQLLPQGSLATGTGFSYSAEEDDFSEISEVEPDRP